MGTMKNPLHVSGCVLLVTTLAALVRPALADSYLHCSTKEAVIISAPNGETSSMRTVDLDFRIDDAAKTVRFLDNTALNVTRFERSRISAERDDVSYEFDRQGGTLNFAGSKNKDGGTSVIIIGSGQCESGPQVKRQSPQK
jgi:hypothetical protein